MGCAVVTAIAWTFLSNRSPLDAAIEIDRRFDLRERVASSLSLSPEDQTSEAGRAVVNDAVRAVQRIDVDEKFRVRRRPACLVAAGAGGDCVCARGVRR